MRVERTKLAKAYAIIRRNDEFPNFSEGTIQELEEYFLYDLDNEEENEFLAAVDLEAVNVTDKVTVEETDKSTEVKKKKTIDL